MTAIEVEAVVTREGSNWLAEVPGMPGAHTYAGNVSALVENLREVVALVLDLPGDAESDVSVHLKFTDADDVISEAARIGEQRAEAEATLKAVQSQTAAAAQRMSAAGYSVRDIAGVLRVTPGRVSQIVGRRESRGKMVPPLGRKVI